MTTNDSTLWHDLWLGFRGLCPKCARGKLFRKYLKVADQCPACGEEFHHHRADDFPAYIVILILGHVIVAMATTVERVYGPPYWVHVALWAPLTLILCLVMLQPVKGAIVALQWRMRMHGFRDRVH